MKQLKSNVFSRRRFFLSAIIVAAGSGTRMGSSLPKQFISLQKIPVVIRTLLQFERCEAVSEIIIVARQGETSWYAPYVEEHRLKKVKTIVPCGETRQQSALLGLQAVSDQSNFVAIHDAARCLILPEQIDAVAQQAFKVGAAAAACHVKDTIKMADANGKVTQTLDRNYLWQVQTPQAFSYELVRGAYDQLMEAEALQQGVTDDAMVVERCGGVRVRMIYGSYENLKVTTPEDLILAEALLSARRGGEKL